MLRTARVFKSGNSQALRLPKDFQFHTKTVEIFKRNDEIVVREPVKRLANAFTLLTTLPDDFFVNSRKDLPPQKRNF